MMWLQQTHPRGHHHGIGAGPLLPRCVKPLSSPTMTVQNNSRLLHGADGCSEEWLCVMQETRSAIQPDAVLRKLNMHIMVKFCLLVRAAHTVSDVLDALWMLHTMAAVATDDDAAVQTLLNHMDRANLVSS